MGPRAVTASVAGPRGSPSAGGRASSPRLHQHNSEAREGLAGAVDLSWLLGLSACSFPGRWPEAPPLRAHRPLARAPQGWPLERGHSSGRRSVEQLLGAQPGPARGRRQARGSERRRPQEFWSSCSSRGWEEGRSGCKVFHFLGEMRHGDLWEGGPGEAGVRAIKGAPRAPLTAGFQDLHPTPAQGSASELRTRRSSSRTPDEEDVGVG